MKKKRKRPKSALPDDDEVLTRAEHEEGERELMLQELADLVRELYIIERNAAEDRISPEQAPHRWKPGKHWDGGVTRRGIRRKNVWKGVAKFLLDNRLDPVDYIQTVFRLREGIEAPPFPNQLCSRKAMNRYHLTRENIREEIEVAFVIQQNVLKASTAKARELLPDESKARTQKFILLDETTDMSALFRYCLAVHEGLERVARIYEQEARIQYLRDYAVYNEVWGEWIPAAFKRQAGSSPIAKISQGC